MNFTDYLSYLIESDNEEYGFIYNKKNNMYARTLDGSFGWVATKKPNTLFSKNFYNKEFKRMSYNDESINLSDIIFRTDYKFSITKDPSKTTFFSNKSFPELLLPKIKKQFNEEFEIYEPKETPEKYTNDVIRSTDKKSYIYLTIDDFYLKIIITRY